MAEYGFKINIELHGGISQSFFNASFANSTGSTYIDAPTIVDTINNMPLSRKYIQSEVAPAEADIHTSIKYDGENGYGSDFLAVTFTGPSSPGDADSGSVVFTDTESTQGGGLKKYTFWGTKVCSVLGLPEGIPIYPENFKLSDDQNDPDNYMSGDIIASGISIKESFKLTTQARVKGNLVWDQVFGEGYAQWVSGSSSDLRLGYNPDNNVYEMIAGTVQMNIEGIDELGATNITASGHINVTDYVTALGGIHVGGTSDPGTDNLVVDGNITVNGTVDGRDLATDGSKLDGIEASADVTDTTNVTNAGALMDSELADITAVKGINQDLTTTSNVTFNNVNVNGSMDGDGSTNITDINSLEVSAIYGYNGDTNTGIQFSTDQIDFSAGSVKMLTLDETTQDTVVINEDGVDVDFRIEGDTNTVLFKTDAGDDFVAIGASTRDADAASRLTVHQNTQNFVISAVNSTNDDNSDGIMVNYTNRADLGTSAHFFRALDSNDDTMYLAKGNNSGGSTVVTSFTAGHDTACLDEDELMPGLIIESTGEVWFKPSASFETALPFTRLSNSNGSKTVFGVVDGVPLQYDATGSITNVRPEEERFVKGGYLMTPAFNRYAKHAPTGSANRQLNTMSLGEGVMWVTNHNGNIENGDYIESSVIKGYGRKQDDDILRSKTVAKCTEAINWAEVTSSIQYSGNTYKKYLAAVTFHCG